MAKNKLIVESIERTELKEKIKDIKDKIEELENAEESEEYDEMLNECYPTYKMGYSEFDASDILKNLDPTAYNIGLHEYQQEKIDEFLLKTQYENLDMADTMEYGKLFEDSIIEIESIKEVK